MTSPPSNIPDDHSNIPDDQGLLRRMIGGDPAAVSAVLAAAPRSDDPSLLAAAALLSSDRAHLVRGSQLASNPGTDNPPSIDR